MYFIYKQDSLISINDFIFIGSIEEMQINLCETTEKYRQCQESLIDMNQIAKTYDLQLQSLKIEKSKLYAEYQLVKTNLESYENEKYE